jgi:transposase-like protein
MLDVMLEAKRANTTAARVLAGIIEGHYRAQ